MKLEVGDTRYTGLPTVCHSVPGSLCLTVFTSTVKFQEKSHNILEACIITLTSCLTRNFHLITQTSSQLFKTAILPNTASASSRVTFVTL